MNKSQTSAANEVMYMDSVHGRNKERIKNFHSKFALKKLALMAKN